MLSCNIINIIRHFFICKIARSQNLKNKQLSDKSQALQYGDTLYYNVKVSNGATEDDHFHHGNVLHAKIKVVLALPDIVRFVGNYDEDGNYIDDAMYLIHQQEDGTVNRYTFAESSVILLLSKLSLRVILPSSSK